MKKNKPPRRGNAATKTEKIITVVIAVLLLTVLFVCIASLKGIGLAIAVFIMGFAIAFTMLITVCIVFELPPYSEDC